MDNQPDTLSVSEAAAALGISTDAVRKRLTRGTLQGVKDDTGQWRITLPAMDATSPDGGGSTVTQPDGVSSGALLEMVERLTMENARNAAAAAMWQERARNLESQLLALQPGDAPENEAVESPETGDNVSTGINTHSDTDNHQGGAWGWWKRLFGGK